MIRPAWRKRMRYLLFPGVIGLIGTETFVAGQAGPPSADAVIMGELLVEPPTLINLGFELHHQQSRQPDRS